jgi:epoxyqueuosine reductase
MATVQAPSGRGELTQRVKDEARAVGFDLVGVSTIGPATHPDEFRRWLDAGNHRPMDKLAQNVEIRTDPRVRHPWARSVIALAVRYDAQGVAEESEAGLAERARVEPLSVPPMACDVPGIGPMDWRRRDPAQRARARAILARSPGVGIWPWIARYERNANYHRINDGRLSLFAARLQRLVPEPVRVQPVVEHDAFFERDLGYQGGIGWIGKNNLLIHPRLGSFFVLTSLFTDLELAPDAMLPDFCGTCTACLDSCPTGALDGPYNLIVERCLSARSISIDGPVPALYVDPQAGHLSGCDICQDVCPYNRRHGGSPDSIPPAPERWSEATILDLLECDEQERHLLFAGSLVGRIPLDMIKRNAALIAGRIFWAARGEPWRESLDLIAREVDAQDRRALRAAVETLLDAPTPTVREAAAWALAQ